MLGGSIEDQLNAAALAQLSFSTKLNHIREEDLESLDAENQALMAKAKSIQKLIEESIRKGANNSHRAIRINSIIQKYSEYSKIIFDTKRRIRTKRLEEEERNSLITGVTARQGSTVAIDILHKEGDTLDKSNKSLNEIEDSAISALKTLGQQNQTLKNLHRRMLDLASSIGVSHSVVRHIQRRLMMDRIIMWGGMVVTLIVLIVCWYFFRR
eukprot:TRINITY_DN16627_c0_g1_i1.p1 TRINITY_DN16627_c0_g1~~TRINITY_DN16627_c0_g1_i1.p1  ORF type:complete len:212 (-),score=43.78 TRINITY_DN16627_c0_g1_i1:32-667(-)